MGYDLMGTTEEACPCGKSLKITSRYMDDWNRTKNEHEMVCETCRNEYTHEKGYWVKIVDWQKKENAVKKYNAKRLSVEKLAAEELADEWYQYFAHIKTKKAFHLALTEEVESYSGTGQYMAAAFTKSRFNKEVARKSMEESIKHLLDVWLRYRGTQGVMKKISSENEKMIAESELLEKLFAEKRAAEIEFNNKLN